MGNLPDNFMVEFHEGVPDKEGYYLVVLTEDTIAYPRKLDVDLCRRKSESDGGGWGWANYYAHNIYAWAALPDAKYERFNVR